MKIVGIDPGLSGAIAQWDGEQLIVESIPAVKSAGRGREVDWYMLNSLWESHFYWADHAFLERVSTRPQEGRSSAFKFGTVFGGLRGLLAAHHIPVTLVTPTMWKKSYGIVASKSAAVLLAGQLFPANAADFRGPKGGLRDGVAEAALIAKYGYDKLKR